MRQFRAGFTALAAPGWLERALAYIAYISTASGGKEKEEEIRGREGGRQAIAKGGMDIHRNLLFVRGLARTKK